MTGADVQLERDLQVLLCWLEDGGRSHRPRNVGSPERLEKARDMQPSLEHGPADTWTWVQETCFGLLTSSGM